MISDNLAKSSDRLPVRLFLWRLYGHLDQNPDVSLRGIIGKRGFRDKKFRL